MEKFSFLSAPRFWVMIVGALAVYGEAKGWLGEPEMVLIASLSAIFITVQTVDRFGDKKVEAEVVKAMAQEGAFSEQ